jgi:N-acetylneuraminate synthase
VGIGTSKIKLNAYSSTPAQVNKWIESWKEADVLCGAKNRTPGDHSETSSLASLMRGVYARKKIRKGRPVRRADVFFAMPLREGQMTSGEWKDDCVADRDYAAREAISEQIARRRPTKKEIVYQSIHEIKGMLNEARIAVGTEFTVELSHHYGIEHFRETGATIIDCINRAYCKKIIVLLPGQKHPYHYHRKKEETFQVLAGEMVVEMEGRPRKMLPGDLLTVQPGVWHKFQSDSGVMFEEVSTTHLNDDSFYEDKYINQVGRDERKTRLINWGMHQFD